MRAKLSIFLFLALSIRLAAAADLISFSSELPKEWVMKLNQQLAKTSETPQAPFTGQVIVLQNTNTARSMMISASLIRRDEIDQTFEKNARNWLAGMVDGIRGDNKLRHSKLDFKTVNGKRIAEARFEISFPESPLYGFARYWQTTNCMAACTILGGDSKIDKDKSVLAIASSVHVTE